MAMKFPQYVSTSERTISVVGLIDREPLQNDLNEMVDSVKEDESTTEEDIENLDRVQEEVSRKKIQYRDGKGYVDENEQIWIYCSEGEPKNPNSYPYFWINDNGEKEFSNPSELIKKAYSVDNMVDITVDNIIDSIEPGAVFYNEEEINDMNAGAAFFVPTFRETDDFLKKIVKTTISEKGIDINRLKGKTEEKYVLPNMKSALQNKTKMSVIYFCSWMDLLGCDFEITVVDSGEDKTDPLKKTLVYQSYRDKVGALINGELQEINTNNYIQEEEEE